MVHRWWFDPDSGPGESVHVAFKVLSVTPTERRGEWKIKTELEPRILARLLGVKTVQIYYVGSLATWYQLPHRIRCDAEMSDWLHKHWDQAQKSGQNKAGTSAKN